MRDEPAPATLAGCPEHAVVHVGDTAGVPQQLVAALRAQGVSAFDVVPPTALAHLARRWKVLAAPWRLVVARRIAAQARQHSARLLHVHYATSALGYLWARVPLVVHAHGSDVRSVGAIDRRLLAAVWRGSRLRIVATPDLLDHVPDAVYLPNPIDCDRFRDAAMAVPAPPSDVLVFAALTAVKGGDVLVDAVRSLKRARPTLSVTALAGGPFESAMAAAGAHVIPRQAPGELPALLAGHRVVLGQQLLGALGVSELQAMAAGRPVVCHLRPDFDYGSVPPVVVSTGAIDAAERTLELLDRPDWASTVGASGATWVRANHGRDLVGRRLVELYESAELLPR